MNTLTAKRYSTGAALIAGGSGAIGAAISQHLAAGGSDIAITYMRSKEKAEKVAAKVKELGRKASIHQLDLRDVEAVKACVEAVHAEHGGLHTTVYAAGPVIPVKYLSKLTPQEVADTITTDVLGAFNLIHATLPSLRQSHGALVVLGTAAIDRYAKTDALSAAPKAAIEVFVRGVAAEEGRYGVRANTIGVGLLDEGIVHAVQANGGFGPTFMEASKKLMALGRFGNAQEIASAAAFLASDNAGFITGQLLNVDGGFAM